MTSANGMTSTVVSLSLFVGTLLVAGRWLKRSGFRGTHEIPLEAFEILGRRTLEPRVSVHLVRLGSRVLLLGSGADGVKTLSEVDDPKEVSKLLVACKHDPIPQEKSVEAATATTSVLSPSRVAARVFLFLAMTLLSLATGVLVQAQDQRPVTAANRAKDRAVQQSNAQRHIVKQAALEKVIPEAADLQKAMSPEQLGFSLKMLALMTVFSLAPSILMMTTCFVRFTVVLGLLRQALGTQQGLPNQVLSAICLFLTFLVMSPVWQRAYDEGIRPYTNPAEGESSIDEATAVIRTIGPLRSFMSQQIERAGNANAVWMLLEFQRPESTKSSGWVEPQSYDDVPFTVLAPAYLLSELKVGFLIGFQLFLPFLVIDLFVATILTSLGMTMLPPSMVSLPMKLLLFVLVDGWFLTVGMLLESVRLAQ